MCNEQQKLDKTQIRYRLLKMEHIGQAKIASIHSTRCIIEFVENEPSELFSKLVHSVSNFAISNTKLRRDIDNNLHMLFAYKIIMKL